MILFLEQVKIIILKCFWKNGNMLLKKERFLSILWTILLRISSDSDKENSIEENSDKENSNEENFEEENFDDKKILMKKIKKILI